MIPEIGIMIGVFILVRLIPPQWKPLSAVFRAVAFVVAFLVVADLGVRGFSDRTLASLIAAPADPPPAQVSVPESPDDPQATTASTFSVSIADGGSITTKLGYGIAVAEGSSLNREWIAIHDSAFPVDFEGTPGVRTVYKSERYSGQYRYLADFILVTRAAVRAFQVRFLTFDVWGNHVRTLSYEEVIDVPSEASKKFTGEWSLYSENDVERHYASIAYVARVRLADGRVLHANDEPVLVEARKFFAKFTAADLEPSPARKDVPKEGEETP